MVTNIMNLYTPGHSTYPIPDQLFVKVTQIMFQGGTIATAAAREEK